MRYRWRGLGGLGYTPFPPRDVFAAGLTLVRAILNPADVPRRELVAGFSDWQLSAMLSAGNGIDDGLAPILRQALHSRMTYRQHDGAELADDLAQWLDQRARPSLVAWLDRERERQLS